MPPVWRGSARWTWASTSMRSWMLRVFEGQGDYASALEYANQCVRRDPLEEDGYRD